MSESLTIHLNETTYAALEKVALATGTTPSQMAASALEKQYGGSPPSHPPAEPDAESRSAKERFERHFGSVDLGHPTGTENPHIDADLAKSYAEKHEKS